MGIVGAIARAICDDAKLLWVAGSTERVDQDLRRRVMELRDMARVTTPPEVAPFARSSNPMRARKLLESASGTMLYVDHTYFEADGRRSQIDPELMELAYKP